MALNEKKRGRKPSKKTLKARTKEKMQRHWLDCHVCGDDGAEVDGDITKFTCGRCAMIGVAPPVLSKALTDEEKKARKERREAREKRKKDILAGKIPASKVAIGVRGWHLKILFTAEVNGKQKYYSRGKEITKAAYKKIEKEQAAKKATKADEDAVKHIRGWHKKDIYVGPEGETYMFGELVLKANKNPTDAELEREFEQLMEQHVNGKGSKGTFIEEKEG